MLPEMKTDVKTEAHSWKLRLKQVGGKKRDVVVYSASGKQKHEYWNNSPRLEIIETS